MDYGTDMMLRKVDAMRKNGYDEETIAKFFGLSKIELRKHISMRNRDNRIVLCSLAKKLKEEGKSVREIAIKLGKNESSVRLLLDTDVNDAMKGGGIPFDQVLKENEEFRRTHDTIPIAVEVQRASLAERA